MCALFGATAQQVDPEPTGLVKWLDIKTAQELNKTQPKPMIIDVYTDWCGWCKHMMKTTFSNKDLANYINTYFYPVRLNAETKDTIEFLDKKYINKSEGTRPPHDLAIYLLEGKMSYPTIIFFNNNFKFKLIVPGYLSEKDIEPVLVYVVEYIFGTTSVEDYRKYFLKAFYPDSADMKMDTVTWLKSFNEAAEKNDVKKKKTLLFVNAPWCNGGRTMLNSTFNHSMITKYINDHFYPVLMDAQSMDIVKYNNQIFVNTVDNNGFHPFLHNLLGDRIVLPTVLFFDEYMQYINFTGQYLTPENLYPILQYFSEDYYKNTPWNDYYKAYQEKNPK